MAHPMKDSASNVLPKWARSLKADGGPVSNPIVDGPAGFVDTRLKRPRYFEPDRDKWMEEQARLAAESIRHATGGGK